MKVILNVPDEGYYERTWWRLFWAYLMKVILNVILVCQYNLATINSNNLKKIHVLYLSRDEVDCLMFTLI
jgi:hypothetical protein